MGSVATFTVWKTETCTFCQRARGFLDALQNARPDVEVRFRDAHKDPAGFRAVARKVGRSTVPQIFLDGHYLGGWDDLARAAASGRLDAFLEGREWPAPKRGLFARFRRA